MIAPSVGVCCFVLLCRPGFSPAKRSLTLCLLVLTSFSIVNVSSSKTRRNGRVAGAV